MKILSIGNSFSQDAHAWLKPIFEEAGVPCENVNLYIGGCSLETHWQNMTSDVKAYDYEASGKLSDGTGKVSILEVLKDAPWDIITFQQASHFSGRPQTYIPYLPQLASAVQSVCPSARFYIHQTWAYEKESTHPAFLNYNHDQSEMFRRLCDANAMASRLIGAPIIPVGKTIQRLRDTCSYFDLSKGGMSLNRDGFHLSLLYGRYTASSVWFETLTGQDITESNFIPVLETERTDPDVIAAIRETVHAVCLED